MYMQCTHNNDAPVCALLIGQQKHLERADTGTAGPDEGGGTLLGEAADIAG